MNSKILIGFLILILGLGAAQPVFDSWGSVRGTGYGQAYQFNPYQGMYYNYNYMPYYGNIYWYSSQQFNYWRWWR
mgnify:CR=1 FL=1